MCEKTARWTLLQKQEVHNLAKNQAVFSSSPSAAQGRLKVFVRHRQSTCCKYLYSLKVWLVLWILIRNSSCNGPLKAEYLVSLHEVWTWIYLVYLLFVMFDIVLLFALIPAAAAINMCSLLCYKLNEETGMSHWVNVSRTDLDSCSWGDFCSTAQRARDWKNMMLEIILPFPVKQQAFFLFFFVFVGIGGGYRALCFSPAWTASSRQLYVIWTNCLMTLSSTLVRLMSHHELICSLFSQLMKTLISCLSNVQKTERNVCYGSPEIVDI